MKKWTAFTLIELLVVVTIIVILLALLTPALDRAIYSAELTVCGAGASGTVRGVLSYAMGAKRRYPHRPTLADSSARRRPFMIRDDVSLGVSDVVTTGVGGNTPDDRPYLRAALGESLATLLDPFSPPIDLNHTTLAKTSVHYSLWFGMSYASGERPMLQVGDRVQWLDNSHNRSRRVRSRVLVSDWDLLAPINDGGAQSAINSHPDRDGVLAPYTYVTSEWAESGYTSTNPRRGAVDNQFAYDDGSVQRIDDIKWNDPEMARVPYDYWADKFYTDDTGVWLHLPATP